MLIKHRDIVHAQTVSCLGKIVPCACADWSGCGGHTPQQATALWLLQWWRSRSAQMLLPDYWQVWQRTDLASRFARGSVASTSACLAGLSKRAALSRRSFDNASLWPEALRPLFFLHTALQFWPILSLVVRTSLRPRRAFIATGASKTRIHALM